MHWTRNALAYVPKGQHTMVAARRQAFQQPDDAAARTAQLHVAEMMRARWPKFAAFIIDSEADVALAANRHGRATVIDGDRPNVW